MPLPPRRNPNKPPGGFFERNWMWIAMIMAVATVGVMGSSGQLGIAQAKRQLAASQWAPAPFDGMLAGSAMKADGYSLAIEPPAQAVEPDAADAFADAQPSALDAKQGATVAFGNAEVGFAMISGVALADFHAKSEPAGGVTLATARRIDPALPAPRVLSVFLVASTPGFFDHVDVTVRDKQGVPVVPASSAKHWDGRLLALGLTGLLPPDLAHVELRPATPAAETAPTAADKE